jgi:hypothetical protein
MPGLYTDSYCPLPATSERDKVVARKHPESIQDYNLQTPVLRPRYDPVLFSLSGWQQGVDCVVGL